MVIPYGELAGSDSALRRVEKDIKPAVPHHERSVLQRLPVADTHPITPVFT